MNETNRNESQVLAFDYDALRRRLDEQYRISEYHEKLKALDLVRDMATPKTRMRVVPTNGDEPSSLKKAVIAVLPHLASSFTNEDIIHAVESKYPRFKPIQVHSLRATIHHLKGQGILKPVTVGGGAKRSTYEYVKSMIS